MRQELNFVPV